MEVFGDISVEFAIEIFNLTDLAAIAPVEAVHANPRVGHAGGVFAFFGKPRFVKGEHGVAMITDALADPLGDVGGRAASSHLLSAMKFCRSWTLAPSIPSAMVSEFLRWVSERKLRR